MRIVTKRITHLSLIILTLLFSPLINFPIVYSQESALFWYIRTIEVTPDNTFQTGSFSRINYVPATGNFVVTFGTTHDDSPGLDQGAGFAYKEYTTDMLEPGRISTITWFPGLHYAGDAGSVMIDNFYYFVDLPTDTIGFEGWRRFKFDAIDWTIKDEIYIPLLLPQEKNNDPMVAYVNGLIDISSQYDSSGPPPPLEEGAATHHHFFSTDLEPAGLRILNDTPHVCGSSMIFIDGIYYMVTSNAFLGDLIVMKYDANWNYLGNKMLIPEAHWSQGLVCDGERFYVSYLSTSQRTPIYGLPVHLNVHLAAFDRDWNLIEDVAVTNFLPEDNKQPGRPWIILHDHKLYISYPIVNHQI